MSRKKKKRAKAPVLFETLSEAPNGSLAKRVAYHGARVLLLVLLAAGVTVLFPSEVAETPGLPALGDLATEDVVAEVPFQIPRDSAEIAEDRADVAAAEPPVFREIQGVQDSLEARLNTFFDEIREAVEAGGRPAVVQVLRAQGLDFLAPRAEFFLDLSTLEDLREACLSAVQSLGPRFLGSEHGQDVSAAGTVVIIRSDGSFNNLDADEFLWGRAFNIELRGALGPRTGDFIAAGVDIITYFFDTPFFQFDAGQTETRRASRRSAVPTTDGQVEAGEVFVSQGDRISPRDLRALSEHERVRVEAGLVQASDLDWPATFGSLVVNLLLLGIFGVLLFFFRPEVYRSFRWLFLLTILTATYFLVAFGISWQGYAWQFLPIAFVILPVAILWDGRMALILALVLGAMTGAQEPFSSYQILAFTIMGGAATALSARAVRRRSQTWIFIALITLCYGLVLMAFGLKGEGEPAGVLLSVVYAGANATVSAILAMGFMPVFEWFTGITTDQTLLEWADPNRPLLKSLSLEANGTYAHTINVANLAEAAATAIGANELLTRVGIYYHDVGKMLKPQYFVENQPGRKNPHDKLKPHTSAAIVREHVVEGEKMARDEGVPDVVARFIPEHHGTQLIGFFFGKAQEESGEELDDKEFRYPGPKPQSKETAIAMLADSVESATRVLQDPSPERVKELVQTVVDAKVRDGQLSEAPLTLGEISVIQEQFVKVISGMFHHRLDYPETKHVTDSPKGSESEERSSDQEAVTETGPDVEGEAQDTVDGGEAGEAQLSLTSEGDADPSDPPPNEEEPGPGPAADSEPKVRTDDR